MTAVASPPSFQQIRGPQWGSNAQGALTSMNPEEVARMFMPRKSAQRANSSSSLASNSSGSSTGTATMAASTIQANGAATPASDSGTWTSAGPRKKPQRTGPYPMNKAEPMSGALSTNRPQSMLGANGVPVTSSMQQPMSVVPSQHLQSASQQQNGARTSMQPPNEGNPVLYLLSMNGTFERKTITVPYYPENLRIGRQTNAKTVPTPTNGYFDSKVLSRQHAEIWADRNGKIWIRDVRSSNGTFVNGSRLSAENRDSEPHELQTQDHLELGIDIVSEDQKTVVHHKVAAKVEHAGFLGATNNVLDMNFGDLDPANSGGIMLPSQNGMMRGRINSQGSINSNGRGTPNSIAPSNMSLNHQRPMNFWLTPVTTEQIAKRLQSEMKQARLQINDLGRTEQFFDTLLSKQEFKEEEKLEEIVKPVQVNGGSFRMDGKPRFTDPPAPPPQQPLPEKPDAIKTSEMSLKRSNTEKPKAGSSTSPIRQEPNSEILTLVAQLDTAKKEIESQNARMRDLEELLLKEREARETAEGLAKRLELESANATMNGFAKGGVIEEEAFEPPAEVIIEAPVPEVEVDDEIITTESVEASTTKLQEKLELMMVEMREMKIQMESYRQRAETAETERDADRKTLAEMVEKIRLDEAARARRSSSTERARSASPKKVEKELEDTVSDVLSHLPENGLLKNGTATLPAKATASERKLAMALTRPPGTHDHLGYHSTPYVSMLGVVLLGMGLMAYMNGWQKAER